MGFDAVRQSAREKSQPERSQPQISQSEISQAEKVRPEKVRPEKGQPQQARQELSMTDLYDSIDYAEASKILKDPAKFSKLYKDNQKFIDANGDGNIDKPELKTAITDPKSTADTKQLAKAMLAGYDNLQNYSSVSRTLAEYVPDSKLFREIASHTGISKHDAEAFSRSLDSSELGSFNNINALKAAGLVVGGIVATYVFKQLPSTLIPRSVMNPPTTLTKELLYEARNVPIKLMIWAYPGALTYGGHRMVSWAGNREQREMNDNLFADLAAQKKLLKDKI